MLLSAGRSSRSHDCVSYAMPRRKNSLRFFSVSFCCRCWWWWWWWGSVFRPCFVVVWYNLFFFLSLSFGSTAAEQIYFSVSKRYELLCLCREFPFGYGGHRSAADCSLIICYVPFQRSVTLSWSFALLFSIVVVLVFAHCRRHRHINNTN